MMNLKFFWKTLVETFTDWNNSSATKDAASLAYYAIFSIPGLLIIIIWIAGNFVGQEAIQGQISSQINSMMGTEAAKSVEDIIAGALIDKQNKKDTNINLRIGFPVGRTHRNVLEYEL